MSRRFQIHVVPCLILTALSLVCDFAPAAETPPASNATTQTARASPSPLITRDRVKLNLSGAELVLAVMKEKATEMKLRVNLVVVDDGGHLLAFARMDGARPASAATAITKATAAATMHVPTGPIRRGDAEPDLLLNVSLQNAAAASGGKMTSLFGGVPIVVDGQVIGAVGVGGGTGEQDAEIGRAGVDKLLAELR